MKLLKNILAGILITIGHIFFVLLVYFLNKDNNSHLWISIVSVWISGIVMSYLYYMSKIVVFSFNEHYLRIRKFEYSGRFYKIAGLKIFKIILLHSPFKFLNVNIHFKKKSKTELSLVRKEMEKVETGHIIAFIITLIITFVLAFLRSPKFIVWMTLFNIVFNVYPVFLQRFNRRRINTIINRNNRQS